MWPGAAPAPARFAAEHLTGASSGSGHPEEWFLVSMRPSQSGFLLSAPAILPYSLSTPPICRLPVSWFTLAVVQKGGGMWLEKEQPVESWLWVPFPEGKHTCRAQNTDKKCCSLEATRAPTCTSWMQVLATVPLIGGEIQRAKFFPGSH